MFRLPNVALLLLLFAAAPVWGSVAIDANTSVDRSTASATVASSAFSTTQGNELLLAFISADHLSGANTTVKSISGAGLTWVLVVRANGQSGTSEIWRAFATAPLSNVTVTATLSQSVISSMTIISYAGVDPSGTNGSGAIGATASKSAASGAPTATLVTTRNNSWVFGVGNDFDNAIARTPGSGQSLVHQYLSSAGDTYWVQMQNSPTPLSGTSVSINDTAPTGDRFNLSICEVLPATSTQTWSISGTITPTAGGSGATVALSGAATASTATDGSGNYTFTGLANGNYTVTPSNGGYTFNPAYQAVTVNGANVTGINFTAQAVPTWSISGTISPAAAGAGATVALSGASTGTTIADASGSYTFSGLANGAYTVTPGQGGYTFTPANQQVTVNGASLTGVNFTGQAATGSFSIDATVSKDQATASTTVSTPAFSTTSGNELWLALISTDYLSGTNTTVKSISGAGLTWVLVQRTNAQNGSSEIWRAFSFVPVSNATVTATLSQSVGSSITVMTFAGVDTSGTNGSGAIGATASGSSAKGAPTASLVTTRNGSWVVGVGNDYDNAISRTPGTGQTLVHQYLTPAGDTYWVQRMSSPTALSGTTVTINDTAPTTDRYNLSICEVLPASGGGTPTWSISGTISPSTGISGTTVALSGAASATTTADSNGNYAFGGLLSGTYTVTPSSSAFTFTPPSQPVTMNGANVSGINFTAASLPPTVSMWSPAAGAVVASLSNVSAIASAGTVGVQFLLDGAALGAELTAPPYSMTWNSTTATAGTHTLAARARNSAGQSTTSAAISISVDNSGNPAVVGSWSSVVSLPAVAVNLILLNNNKVLFYQDGSTPTVWDYVNSTFTNISTSADLFCSGHALLADGRVLVVGGYGGSGSSIGISAAEIFDPATNKWTSVPHMAYQRWYPTATTLSDGRILVTAGWQTSNHTNAGIPEIYDPTANQWTQLVNANNPFETYPFIYQLPDGRVIHVGGTEYATDTDILNVSTQTWSVVDANIVDGGSASMYLPSKIMKAGSATDSQNSGPSSNTTFVLDMTQPSPAWRQTPSMAYPRSFLNLTTLPDGTVLATGGETDKNGGNISNAVYAGELWSPQTQTWSTMSSMKTPREYHGTALLLPDGRVLVSGMGADFGNVPDEKSAEFYSPPYLFKGPRPTISQAPAQIQYGTNFFVSTPDGASISSVVLIRTGAVTHFFDENTRYIPLTFQQTAGGLTVTAPGNSYLAPPGYYMLFLVNSSGIPSVAPFVQIPAQ